MDDPTYLQPSGRNQLVALGASPARFSDSIPVDQRCSCEPLAGTR